MEGIVAAARPWGRWRALDPEGSAQAPQNGQKWPKMAIFGSFFVIFGQNLAQIWSKMSKILKIAKNYPKVVLHALARAGGRYAPRKVSKIAKIAPKYMSVYEHLAIFLAEKPPTKKKKKF